MIVTDAAPMFPEFGPGSTSCGGAMTGCAVCATASVLARFGKPVPRTPAGHLDARALGRSMGNRHRAVQPTSRHGQSLDGRCSPPKTGTNWCAYCAYLELKARDVPVAYGQLTEAQIHAHLRARHPIVLPGLYSRVPLVSTSSYSSTVPARGRSDSTFGGTHMVAAFEEFDGPGAEPVLAIVADADFGSTSRRTVPPHSVWTAAILGRYWSALGWPVAYCVTAPPPVGVPPVAVPGVTFRFSGRPTKRGRYVVQKGARVRSSPRILADNVELTTTKPTSFGCAQTTYAGTNVGGSTIWHGTADGSRWVHESVAELAGHTTGKETIR